MSHPQSHPFPHYRPCPIPIIAIHAPVNMYPPIEAKRAEKAKAYATQYKYLYGQLKRSENPKGFLPLQSLRLEGASTAICGCVLLVLMGRGLELILFLFRLLGLSTIGIDALRIRRICRHLELITKDDQLLMQHAASLSHRELREALEERGM